jgi:NADH-quinone oxidoreductase subunit J
LCLAVAFSGLAAFYLQLGAPFVGWAQILVYVGAVAILIVFAILLTRSSEPTPQPVISRSWIAGLLVAILVFGVLTKAILASPAIHRQLPEKAEPAVREIGNQLMTQFVLPLEVMGLLLTAAAIGAVIIAMPENRKSSQPQRPVPKLQ